MSHTALFTRCSSVFSLLQFMNGNLYRILIMKNIFDEVFLRVTLANLHYILKYTVSLCQIYMKCTNSPTWKQSHLLPWVLRSSFLKLAPGKKMPVLKYIYIARTRRFNGTDLYHTLYYVLHCISQPRETFLQCVAAYCMNLHNLFEMVYAFFFASNKILNPFILYLLIISIKTNSICLSSAITSVLKPEYWILLT